MIAENNLFWTFRHLIVSVVMRQRCLCLCFIYVYLFARACNNKNVTTIPFAKILGYYGFDVITFIIQITSTVKSFNIVNMFIRN